MTMIKNRSALLLQVTSIYHMMTSLGHQQVQQQKPARCSLLPEKGGASGGLTPIPLHFIAFFIERICSLHV